VGEVEGQDSRGGGWARSVDMLDQRGTGSVSMVLLG
jgi:hypothetical protein